MYTAAMLWSQQHGTGKSFVGYAMRQIYGTNWTELNEAALRQNYNGWAVNKQFIMADELASSDKRTTSDLLKAMITRETIHVNQKYMPEYDAPDCMNWYFTSNHPDAMFLEDDDRRFFVYEVTNPPAPDSFYTELEHWLRRDIYPDAEGPAALFAHLLTLDLGDFNARARAPETDAKQRMRSMGRSDIGAWVESLRTDPDSALNVAGMVLSHKLFTAADLHRLYDPDQRGRVSANGLSRELSRQGFRKAGGGAQCVTATHGRPTLWVVREDVPPEVFSSPAAAGKYYEEERATPAALRKLGGGA